MESLALFFSTAGRTEPRPFALATLVVYCASFLSQVLVSPPLMSRGGIFAFAIVQIGLIWAWYALHAKRLRDAGLPIGSVQAIATLYTLAMVLLVLVLEPILAVDAGTVGAQARRHGFADLWVFLLLFAALSRQSDLGLFDVLSLGILALILVPIAIAIGFSIWSGTRPSVTRT